MSTDTPCPQATGAEPSALPWFGPTLHELLPDTPPGTRPVKLRPLAARELNAADTKKDPVRYAHVQRADLNSHTPVDALVAEMLTLPLRRDDTEERP